LFLLVIHKFFSYNLWRYHLLLFALYIIPLEVSRLILSGLWIKSFTDRINWCYSFDCPLVAQNRIRFSHDQFRRTGFNHVLERNQGQVIICGRICHSLNSSRHFLLLGILVWISMYWALIDLSWIRFKDIRWNLNLMIIARLSWHALILMVNKGIKHGIW